jgi:hypothetical protein
VRVADWVIKTPTHPTRDGYSLNTCITVHYRKYFIRFPFDVVFMFMILQTIIKTIMIIFTNSESPKERKDSKQRRRGKILKMVQNDCEQTNNTPKIVH